MIRLILLLLLTSPSVFAQQPKKQNPTLKESLEDLKRSGKAIGDLFKKKKNKSVADTVQLETGATEKRLSDTVALAVASAPEDSFISEDYVQRVKSYLTDLNKADKPRFAFHNEKDYCGFEFDFGDGIRSSSFFSKDKKDHVEGDLNGDGKEDMILLLSTQSGGNTEFLDLLIFIHQEGKGPVLEKVYPSSDPELKGCEIGQFIPEKIEQGIITGQSLCFTDSDPRCCPSLKYSTQLKWMNGKLNFIKKQRTQ